MACEVGLPRELGPGLVADTVWKLSVFMYKRRRLLLSNACDVSIKES